MKTALCALVIGGLAMAFAAGIACDDGPSSPPAAAASSAPTVPELPGDKANPTEGHKEVAGTSPQAPPAQGAGSGAAAPPTARDLGSLGGIVGAMFDMASSGDWPAFTILAVLLIVSAIRLGMKRLKDKNKVFCWLAANRWAGWIINGGIAGLTVLGGAAVMGAPITFVLVQLAIAAALGAAGLLELFRDGAGKSEPTPDGIAAAMANPKTRADVMMRLTAEQRADLKVLAGLPTVGVLPSAP